MCGLQLSNYNLRHELETLKGQVQEGNRRLMDDNQRLMNELKAFSRQLGSKSAPVPAGQGSAREPEAGGSRASAGMRSVGSNLFGGRELLSSDQVELRSTSVSANQVDTPLLCAASIETWALSINGTNLVNYLAVEFSTLKQRLDLLVGSISKTPTMSPTSLPTMQPSVSPFSCQSYAFQGITTSGVYTINPGAGSTSYDVYCDMTTDGGGWMLTWAYYHAAGDQVPKQYVVPTDPNGISDRDLEIPCLVLSQQMEREDWGK